MLPDRSQRTSFEERKAQLEFVFWAIRQTLALIVYAALTIYLVVSLVQGNLPGADQLLRLR